MGSLETKVYHEWMEPVMALDQQSPPPHPSPLTSHPSPLTSPPSSPLTPPPSSPLTPHLSPLLPPHPHPSSPLTPHPSSPLTSPHCRCFFHWHEHWSHLPGYHTRQRDYTKVIARLPHYQYIHWLCTPILYSAKLLRYTFRSRIPIF